MRHEEMIEMIEKLMEQNEELKHNKGVMLTPDEVYNLVEFIEFNFLESIRNDLDVDNINYVISMMSAFQKLRHANEMYMREEGCEHECRECMACKS